MIVITVARKASKKGVTDCVLANGCGSLNIEASRVGSIGGRTHGGGYQDEFVGGKCINAVPVDFTPKGRWPANMFVSPDAKDILDAQSGIIKSPKSYLRNADGFNNGGYSDKPVIGEKAGTFSLNFGDVGGASKFFKIFGDKK